MVKKRRNPCLLLTIAVSLLLLTVGCTGPPEQEMSDAKVAVESAKSLKADLYAFDKYKKAIEAHLKAQQAFDAKEYSDAKKLALTAKEEADAAIELAKKNMETFKDEASRAISMLDSTLAEVSRVLENRKELIVNELEELDAGFDLAKKAFDSGDYKKASEKASRLTERANKIMERLEQQPQG